MMASSINSLNMHIFFLFSIETQVLPKARIGKLWPMGQIRPTNCLVQTVS